MEALLSQFSLLSNQALTDKNFDPSTIEELMKFFEIEAYKSWASMDSHLQNEVEQSEISMKEAEDYLDSVMESAMEEFRMFEEEADRVAKAELDSLTRVADGAKKASKLVEQAATMASMKYVEAALQNAMASMRSAKKGFPGSGSGSNNKVHPS